MLPNTGFESGTTGWLEANGSGTSTIVNNPANAHSGSFYGDLTAPTSTAHPILFGTQSNRSKFFPVSPGDLINYGGWAYRASGSGGSARWTIAVYDSNGANPNYYSASPTTVTTPSWIQQQGTYSVATGKAFITVYFELFKVSSSSEVWGDDTSLQQTHRSGFAYTSGGPILQSISLTPVTLSGDKGLTSRSPPWSVSSANGKDGKDVNDFGQLGFHEHFICHH